MNLYHTFQGTASNTSGCAEAINSSNCGVCGDYVCDTPADKNVGSSDGYSPDLTNIMSYYLPADHFTTGQGQRMKTAISREPVLSGVSGISCVIPKLSTIDCLCNSGTKTVNVSNLGGNTTTWEVSSNVSIVSSSNSSITVKAKSSNSNGEAFIEARFSNTNYQPTEHFWVGIPKVEPDQTGSRAISIVPDIYKGASPFPCILYLTYYTLEKYYWELEGAHRIKGHSKFRWQHEHFYSNAHYTETYFGNNTGLYMQLGSYTRNANGYSVAFAENSCGSLGVAGMGWGVCYDYYRYKVSPNPTTTGSIELSFEPIVDPLLLKELNKPNGDYHSLNQPIALAGDVLTLFIHDNNGKQLLEKTIKVGEETQKIDLSGYKRGLYHIKISTSNNILGTTTIIKE